MGKPIFLGLNLFAFSKSGPLVFVQNCANLCESSTWGKPEKVALQKLGLMRKGRGFYCRHNDFWHCANNEENRSFGS